MKRARQNQTSSSEPQPTQTSSSSSNTYEWNIVGDNTGKTLIKDSTKETLRNLTILLERVKFNKEDLPEQDIKNITEEIVSSAQALARTLKEDELRDKYLPEILTTLANQNKLNDVQAIEFEQLLSAAIAKELTKYKPKTDPFLKPIFDLMVQKKKSDEDEDLEILDEEINDRAIRCPYTSAPMKEPYRNNSKNHCIHHISKEALAQLFKYQSSNVSCPVPGCVGKWTKDTTVLDEDFQAKIERYLRVKEIRENSLRGESTAFEIVD